MLVHAVWPHDHMCRQLESADMTPDQDQHENSLPVLHGVLQATVEIAKNLSFYQPVWLLIELHFCAHDLFTIYSPFEICLCEREMNQLMNETIQLTSGAHQGSELLNMT